ncbi:MAG: leucyl/phenylalanyl-tRNA--protein transferase [Planctomycetaceae bacterium]|jgi:leucyl/phenylalanyl-tRNA--protein transferase|nr:leucyl/phenylalanyl-tRNA--protein transferase [Planctomycetaceae bacterium]
MLQFSPYILSRKFPPVEESDEDGLLAMGGELSPEWLLDAYTHGIFPWPANDLSPMLWWSPDPRGILDFSQIHFSRRLLRTCRSRRFQITFNADFFQVISLCAETHRRDGGVWITPAMIRAYAEFHHAGYAKSVEVWRSGKLVGGTYGVSIGGFFAAESMFHTMTDASKVALYFLVERLKERGFLLLDIQMITPHTEKFGGVEISRNDYLRQLDNALAQDCRFD